MMWRSPVLCCATIVAVCMLQFCDHMRHGYAEPACIPDAQTIESTVENIQRIRIELEEANATLQLMREEARKRK